MNGHNSSEIALQIIIEELLPYILEKVEEVEKTAASLRKAQEDMARNMKFIGCDISVVESTVRSLVMSSADENHSENGPRAR